MTVVRYDPWRLFNQMQRDMSHLFDLRQPRVAQSDEAVTAEWSPAVDIREEKDRYVVLADVPGVDPKNIEIHAERGVLSIKGERSHVTNEERDSYKRVERVRGTFYRRFSLPETADTERISARSDHGVLEIVIPKTEVAQPRRIKIEH